MKRLSAFAALLALTGLAAVAQPVRADVGAPLNTTPPTVSGLPRDGETLTADPGTWISADSPTYGYEWQRCDAFGCTTIPDAVDATYRVVSADIGFTLRVQVTATNLLGSSQAVSDPTAPVDGAAPANTSAPAVSGTAQDGELLTADTGTWTGTDPISYGYVWQRCDGGGCVAIDGATGSKYRVAGADVGFTLRVRVTATNAWGSGEADSSTTAPVQGVAPANATAPTVSGTARQGDTLSADHGTWTGTDPISYGYAWQRCDAGGCAAIDGATGSTYRVDNADVGFTLRVEVTATNAWGSAHADSTTTAPVQGVAPANATAPTVSGTPRQGDALSADKGTWTGSTPLSYAYTWQRCTTTGSPCAAIAGATSATYVPTSTDVGAKLRVIVTATNMAGSASATSGATAVVANGSTPVGDPMVVAAGDIACDPASKYFNGGLGKNANCRQKYTADVVASGSYAAVLPLGDEQYDCGGYSAFLRSYDLSWGKFRALSHPAAGDEEYATSGGTDCDTTGKATGYFNYFGAAAGTIGKGWYSYDIGSWHVVVLNSNCASVGGCTRGSAQEKWLKSDLSTHPSRCTLAYWHHPRFSSNGAASSVGPLWTDLANAGADLLLTGHRHNYERFAPQSPTGTYDPVAGIREFVVGTGGKSHQAFPATAAPATSEVRDAKTYGVLELTLHAGSYDWRFRPADGGTFTDSGSTACH